jgi:uncharacterized repeat protein (TIGR03847 family)
MPGQHIELHTVNRITINTIGQPGQRVFLLQASDAIDSVTLKIEKQQARALAQTAQELIDNLNNEYPQEDGSLDKPNQADLMLHSPMEPLFQVGQIGLGYDRDRDLVVLATQELLLDESEEASTARFWVSRSQLAALCQQALNVVEKGRPICPLCNQPMEPGSDICPNFCPKQNGHSQVLQ